MKIISTITLTEEDGQLTVIGHIPEEAKTQVSGQLAIRIMGLVQETMNRLTGQEKDISFQKMN